MFKEFGLSLCAVRVTIKVRDADIFFSTSRKPGWSFAQSR
jgi:hypothetical protein